MDVKLVYGSINVGTIGAGSWEDKTISLAEPTGYYLSGITQCGMENISQSPLVTMNAYFRAGNSSLRVFLRNVSGQSSNIGYVWINALYISNKGI